MKAPAIVVIAYNRPHSLSRLLNSLLRAHYTAQVTLVISIDFTDVQDVYTLAESFMWPYGQKIIIKQEKRLGLKHHVLACGSLTTTYDSIIMLEDDILVSPFFYEYAVAAISFYAEDAKVFGISLFNYCVSENYFAPFFPVHDGTDVYFIQVASSWGLVLSHKKWSAFVDWLSANSEPNLPAYMPDYLKHWGTQSWKKHLNHYLHVTDSFFVFPRIGLSTNFDDPGNHADRSGLFQTTLLQGSKKIVFAALQESSAIYDSWFEIKPICIKRLRPEWRTYDFTVDLYGTKNLETVTTPYLLSSKKCAVPIKAFGNQIPGATENILQTVDGNFFYLGQTAHFRPLSRSDMSPFHISIRALSDLVFRQYLDYPPLIVFIQSTGINSDLLQTLQSVYSQGYNPNHLEVKIVCQSDECIDLPEQFLRAELILLQKGESYLAVVTELVKQSASVYGVLAIAGDVFFDDAFNTVSKVFKTYPYIYWITGAYAERSKAGFSKSGCSLPQNRWTKDIFYKNMYKRKRKDIVPSSTFWRCANWLQASASTYTLHLNNWWEYMWYSLLDKYPLYSCNVYLSSIPRITDQRTRYYFTNKLIEEKAYEKIKEFFFINNVPYLRSLYKNQQKFAQVIRFDFSTGSFHLYDY